MISRHEIMTSARIAGLTRRYHTWPMHTTQSVGEHSFNCMRLWWQIFGPMPPIISTYFLWHDLGELVTGDLPYPVKKNNPELKKIIDHMEDAAVEAMGGAHVVITRYDQSRTKLIDLLEMCEHGIHEHRLGNQYAQPIIDDTAAAVRALWAELSKSDQAAVTRYVTSTGVGVAWEKLAQ